MRLACSAQCHPMTPPDVCSRPVLRRHSASITAPATSRRSRARWRRHLVLPRHALPRSNRSPSRPIAFLVDVGSNGAIRKKISFEADTTGLVWGPRAFIERWGRSIIVAMNRGLTSESLIDAKVRPTATNSSTTPRMKKCPGSGDETLSKLQSPKAFLPGVRTHILAE
jgi:hypothetical protein